MVEAQILPTQERVLVDDYNKHPYNSIGRVCCSFNSETIQKEKLKIETREESVGTGVLVG